MKVHNGNNKYMFLIRNVKHPIRKPRNQATAHFASDFSPAVRIALDLFDAIFYGIKKSISQASATVIVIICSVPHFVPGFGMKDHGLHRNSSRICANTSCAGMPVTFPCRSSWYRLSASLIQASSMSENSSSSRLCRSRSARAARAFEGNDKAV